MRIGSAGIAPGAIPPTTARTRRPTSALFTLDIVDPPSWPFARPGVSRREATMARPSTRGQGITTRRVCYDDPPMASGVSSERPGRHVHPLVSFDYRLRVAAARV